MSDRGLPAFASFSPLKSGQYGPFAGRLGQAQAAETHGQEELRTANTSHLVPEPTASFSGSECDAAGTHSPA